MPYSVQQLATLAGISVRTLHHYDEVGLLQPTRQKSNGYRQYGEAELLRLQQILFFRELEFPLEEIRKIMSSPHFDMQAALHDQRKLIELKKKRLTGLLHTIDNTMKKLTKEKHMSDQDLYGDFNKDEMDQYSEEAKQRWGHTEAWKQSQERTKHWTKADYAKLKEDGNKFMTEFATHMSEGPTSPAVQERIAQQYNALRTFYEPNLEMYRGLANMYVDDPRFAAFYEKFAPGLSVFMREAILHYVDVQEGKK